MNLTFHPASSIEILLMIKIFPIKTIKSLIKIKEIWKSIEGNNQSLLDHGNCSSRLIWNNLQDKQMRCSKNGKNNFKKFKETR